MGHVRRGNLGRKGWLMPRANKVNKFVSVLAGLAMLQGMPAHASLFGLGGIFNSAPDLSAFQENDLTCSGPGYTPDTPNGIDPSSCKKCQQEIRKYSQEVPDQYKISAGKTSLAEGATSEAVVAITGAAEDTQSAQLAAQKEGTNVASKGLKATSEAAAELGRVAGECKAKMTESCTNQMSGQDIAKAQKVLDACDKIAKNADKTAIEKAGGGMDMASLAQLAGVAMQAMQAMKPSPKPEGSESGLSPSSSDYGKNSTPENASGSSLDSKLGNAGSTSIGSTKTNTGGSTFGSAKPNPNGSTFGAGSGSRGAAFNSQSRAPELAESLGGTSADSKEGLAGGPSAASGSGGGGGNSSGASKMEEDAAAKAAAAAAEAAYELPAGGGGGGGSRPAFLGLKANSSELEGEGEGAGEGMLGELGLEEESGRELASEESQGDGISANDGVSLFKVIHTKYADIKKRGNI
jgi:hypothetical protein